MASMVRLVSRRAAKKIGQIVAAPPWLLFKLSGSATSQNGLATIDPSLKESSLRKILANTPNGRFLEIGIGEYPHFERLTLMQQHSISYTGCDFESVCKSHRVELEIKKFDTKHISFATNSTGTYSWTLFEMLQKGEQFDAIYLDGHHTFYIDLPALLLADKLLKPGGYLLLDDIPWTLSFLKANMMRSLGQWYFYRRIYKFSDYTKEQQSLPHIRMIAEEFLLKRSDYTKDEALSLPHWWALRKPL